MEIMIKKNEGVKRSIIPEEINVRKNTCEN